MEKMGWVSPLLRTWARINHLHASLWHVASATPKQNQNQSQNPRLPSRLSGVTGLRPVPNRICLVTETYEELARGYSPAESGRVASWTRDHSRPTPTQQRRPTHRPIVHAYTCNAYSRIAQLLNRKKRHDGWGQLPLSLKAKLNQTVSSWEFPVLNV